MLALRTKAIRRSRAISNTHYELRRLYQGTLYFENVIRFTTEYPNVILFTPVRNVWSSMCQLFETHKISTAKFANHISNFTQTAG
jgi:hypothetical protein